MRSPALTVHIVGIAYGCVRMLIGAISVAYLMRAGLSLPQIGLLKSFQAAVIVFIDIPLSYFSDHYSRKFSIALSVLFSAIWLALTGISEGFYGFLLAEFFNALSLGMMSGTFSAYLYDVSKSEGADHQAVTIFARYQKNQFFFMGIASLLGAGVFTLEPRLAWFMAALLMSVVLLITWFLPSDNFFKAPKDRAMMGRLKADMASMREVFRQNGQVGQAVILLALGYGLVLQSLIQYWQVLADIEHGNLPLGVLLGAVFFVVLMAQSLSGKPALNLSFGVCHGGQDHHVCHDADHCWLDRKLGRLVFSDRLRAPGFDVGLSIWHCRRSAERKFSITRGHKKGDLAVP